MWCKTSRYFTRLQSCWLLLVQHFCFYFVQNSRSSELKWIKEMDNASISWLWLESNGILLWLFCLNYNHNQLSFPFQTNTFRKRYPVFFNVDNFSLLSFWQSKNSVYYEIELINVPWGGETLCSCSGWFSMDICQSNIGGWFRYIKLIWSYTNLFMEKTSFNSKIILFCFKLISAVLCSRGKSRPRWSNACLFIGRIEKVIQAGSTDLK